MPNHLTKIFAIVVAFVCCSVFATDISTSSVVRKKPMQPLYVYLPENSTALLQKPADRVSWFASDQNNTSRFNITANQARSDAGSAAPFLYLGQEVRPSSSLALGFLPPKGSVNIPGPYQYASMDTDAKDCRTAEKPPRNAAETSDNGNKGLRLPIGWSVEMCLHF